MSETESDQLFKLARIFRERAASEDDAALSRILLEIADEFTAEADKKEAVRRH